MFARWPPAWRPARQSTLKKTSQVWTLRQRSRFGSLPLASVPVKIDGHSYLDGGCACPIPINWALRQGFAKIVIVATREKGFRKKQPSQRMVDLYDDFYGDKPLFLATLLTQEMRYNALLDQIDALEDEGRICVIRPDEPVGIGPLRGQYREA